MPVLKMVLAYDGTGFHGWARQPRMRTVQGVLEDALGKMLGEVPRISVAGRTDAGVHAAGQVVSFRTDQDPARLQRGVNGMLAPEVVVLRCGRAPDGFDARRSARAREYRYRVRASRWPDPFTARFEWHRPEDLRIGRMRRAARLLEGEHDFASFSRGGAGSSVRTLERLAVRPEADLVHVRARAGGFLHQMVRSLVGTLVDVGAGRMEPDAVAAALTARDRSAAGRVAPPYGLMLERVVYGG